MIINIITNIYVEVEDTEEAEQASAAVAGGLESAMRHSNYPHSIVEVDVDHYEPLSEEQISELGFEE